MKHLPWGLKSSSQRIIWGGKTRQTHGILSTAMKEAVYLKQLSKCFKWWPSNLLHGRMLTFWIGTSLYTELGIVQVGGREEIVQLMRIVLRNRLRTTDGGDSCLQAGLSYYTATPSALVRKGCEMVSYAQCPPKPSGEWLVTLSLSILIGLMFGSPWILPLIFRLTCLKVRVRERSFTYQFISHIL